MDSNKLGLKIVRINQGYTDLFEINGDQLWTKNIWDIRKDLENIDNLDDSSAVLMLTSIDTGHILTVASLIEGRITDCISAWMYVPASINISGKELVEIVDVIKKEILSNERNDERLTKLFSKLYESALATKKTIKSNGEKCAYRYYGQGAKYTLSELLKDMYQSYYKDYKSIFLLDNSTELKCIEGDNLSDQKVYPMVVVKSPGEFDSFVPYIGFQPFDKPIYRLEREVIKIEWRRNGYLPIQTEVTVHQDMTYSFPMSYQYIRRIPFGRITVVNEKEQPIDIDKYDLNVIENQNTHRSEFHIPESKINNVCVNISAKGYESICKNVDLTQKVVITLKRKESNKNKKESVLKGENKLRLKFFTGKFCFFCLICFIIVLSLSCCYFLYNLMGKEIDNGVGATNAVTTGSTPEQSEETPESESILDAISYLETHDVWNKDEMEKIEPLQGLWDVINERKFDDFKKYEDKLANSNKFMKIVNEAKMNPKKKNQNYITDPSDIEISINIYIVRLKSDNSTPENNDKEFKSVDQQSKNQQDYLEEGDS